MLLHASVQRSKAKSIFVPMAYGVVPIPVSIVLCHTSADVVKASPLVATHAQLFYSILTFQAPDEKTVGTIDRFIGLYQ